ncbi:MAG: PAS-domain containing protein [Shimia sp.]
MTVARRADLLAGLAERFSHLPQHHSTGALTLPAKDGSVLRVSPIGSYTEVTITQPLKSWPRVVRDRLIPPRRCALSAQTRVGIWSIDAEGGVTDHNRHGEGIARLVQADAATWSALRRSPPVDSERLLTIGDAPYRITADRQGDTMLFTAFPAEDEQSERAAADQALQTLSRTFAHLSVGLAVFDRDLKLTLFNPALGDVVGLPAHALTRQPSLGTFLDLLRRSGQMAEPLDYNAWRATIQAFALRPDAEPYEDRWSLPGGRTIRVSGRPHGNGAMAFAFDDITHQTDFSRTARCEIDQAHAALDAIPEALVVFDADGTAAFSNLAYQRLWGIEAGTGLIARTAHMDMPLWEARAPGLTEALRVAPIASPLCMTVTLTDGGHMNVDRTSLMGGAWMIRFDASPNRDRSLGPMNILSRGMDIPARVAEVTVG